MSALVRWCRRWWLGLIPLALLWVAAAWTTTLPLEKDLGERAFASLKDSVLDKPAVTAAGRDVIFWADAFSEQGRLSALGAVETVPGVRLVENQTRLVAEAKPFIWSVERDVVRITLTGAVPLPGIKARLAEATRLLGGDIVDRTEFARGAPARFEAAALLLIDQIGRLKDGKLVLSDTKVNLSGMAREPGGREAINAALKNLPDGFSVSENAIMAPPYIFQANKDPVTSTVTIFGYVPDNSVHASLIGSATRKFFSDKIVDNLKASAGAPAGFTTAANLALSALSRLSTGSLTISDRDINLSGDALYAAASDRIRGGLEADAPQGWKVKADITVKPSPNSVDPTVCQQLFSELLAKGKIRFESRRAAFDQDSLGLLDRLTETALRCPNADLEVSGHTDSDGDAAANKTLSERRAQAVSEYLVKAGFPPDRLSAAGYGSDRPAASNDNDDGKAQNRRIDFMVK